MSDSSQIPAAAALDLSSLTTNLVIFAAFISAAIGGIWSGLKKVRESVVSGPSSGKHTPLSGAMIEVVTLSDWSDSNREVAEAVKNLVEATYALRNSMSDTSRDLADLRHAISELRHKIELASHKNGD